MHFWVGLQTNPPQPEAPDETLSLVVPVVVDVTVAPVTAVDVTPVAGDVFGVLRPPTALEPPFAA